MLDELSIDQGFASFVFSPDFETKALMNATKESGGGESAYELCHLLAFLLHRVPYQNDGTRRLWMGGGVDGNLFRSVISVAGECSDFNRDPFVIGVEHSGKGIQVTRFFISLLFYSTTIVLRKISGSGCIRARRFPRAIFRDCCNRQGNGGRRASPDEISSSGSAFLVFQVDSGRLVLYWEVR